MDEKLLDEKLTEIRKKRETKRRKRRIRKIIKINLGMLLLIGILTGYKFITKQTEVKVQHEDRNKDSAPLVARAKEPEGEESDVGDDSIGAEKIRTFPQAPDQNPESITAIINKDFPLPSTYVPADLTVPNVEMTGGHYSDKNKIRKPAATALEKLFEAAQKEEISLVAISGYRSFKRQAEIYYGNVKRMGYEEASAISAFPGSSEHQSGLSIDVSCRKNRYDLTEEFCDMEEGKWVKENAHKFGFIIRYPKDKTEVTGYDYEPWHLRFVGEELAEFLYENNLTMEEYYGLSGVKK